MDEAKLKGLERLLAEATPGPWEAELPADHDSYPCNLYATPGECDLCVARRLRRPDAALIVAAINALPLIIKRVRELEAQVRSRVPPPREVSPEEMRAATEEGRALREALDKATKGME